MSADDPDVVAEVEAVFARYETALIENDLATLGELFWEDERTIRFGIQENLYGAEAIAAFRATRPSIGLNRRLAQTAITTFGRDVATVSTLFYRDDAPGQCGRQMQTWLRTEAGWRIVAAHVSLIADPRQAG
ncbi:oxalurate catabolism protein HpxZ [Labrys monachus]|uniref:oxalurate catabolism protein HpxZ n=1 Tax=Labrys monachus TaxID=217067 RepID=UPI0027D830B7|nr:oxalurate catabolism protein HpxZ [Labrys monachus]